MSDDHFPRRKERKVYQIDPHRALPQSIEAEKGALGSALLSPIDVLGLCAEMRVTPDWFCHPAHQVIFQRVQELWNCNEPIDLVTVTQHLRDLGELDSVGGPANLTDLFSYMPTTANVRHYLDILDEKHRLRRVIDVATQACGRAYDEQDDVAAMVDQFETDALSIRSHTTSAEASSAKPLVIAAINSIESVMARKGGITGLPTGFPEFDEATDGLRGSDLIVIGARPSMGKTAIAMNIAEHIAVDCGRPVGVFSLEMSNDQLMQRLLLSRARLDMARIRAGYFSNQDMGEMTGAASQIASAPIFFDDTASLSIQELTARARRMKQKHKIEALFVDYLQLIRSNSKRARDSRVEELTEVSAGLKAIAKELGIPVVVPAQLTRDNANRAAQGSLRPRLSDLRGSGSIEQDADVIAFLVRPEIMLDDAAEREAVRGQATLIIAKQRNGPLADIPLNFVKEYTRFEPANPKDIAARRQSDLPY